MGADKALVLLDGRPMVVWVAERFEPQVEALALSANDDPARFAHLGLPVLPDDTSKGPLSGILSGLNWAAPLGASALVSVPCDGPFLPPDLVPRLCLAGEGGWPAMATTGRDLHPTCALWPVSLIPALTDFLASDAIPRLRDFATAHGARLAAFPQGSFTNANTPEDLSHLQSRLAGQA
jgi:molybdopterin-guanine dinucleotide biosynthesis protein A